MYDGDILLYTVSLKLETVWHDNISISVMCWVIRKRVVYDKTIHSVNVCYSQVEH